MPRHNTFVPQIPIPQHYEFIIGTASDAAYFSTIFHTTLGPGSRVQLNYQQYEEWSHRGVAAPSVPVERETSPPWPRTGRVSYNVSIDQQGLYQQAYQSSVQDWFNQNPDTFRQAQNSLNASQSIFDRNLHNILSEAPRRPVEAKHRATVSPLPLP